MDIHGPPRVACRERGALILWWNYNRIGTCTLLPPVVSLVIATAVFVYWVWGSLFLLPWIPRKAFPWPSFLLDTLIKHLLLCAQLCAKCYSSDFSLKHCLKPGSEHQQFLKPSACVWEYGVFLVTDVSQKWLLLSLLKMHQVFKCLFALLGLAFVLPTPHTSFCGAQVLVQFVKLNSLIWSSLWFACYRILQSLFCLLPLPPKRLVPKTTKAKPI